MIIKPVLLNGCHAVCLTCDPVRRLPLQCRDEFAWKAVIRAYSHITQTTANIRSPHAMLRLRIVCSDAFTTQHSSPVFTARRYMVARCMLSSCGRPSVSLSGGLIGNHVWLIK